MNLSTQPRRRSIRVAPESYTATATTAASLRARLEPGVVRHINNNHKALSSSSSLSVASSPSLILSSTSKHKQHQHQRQPITIPSNLSFSDVFIGELLGSGAYASVYNVSFQTKNKRQKAHSSPSRLQFENCDDQQQQQQPPESRNQNDVDEDKDERSHDDTHHSHLKRHHLKHCHHLKHHNDDHNTQYYYYALKCLQQDKLLIQGCSKNSKAAKIATTDFFMECKILSKIAHYKHPNIIGLIGISNNFASDPSRGFLILEKVSETLQQALVRWRGKQRNNNSTSSLSSNNHNMDCNHNRLSILPKCHHHQRRNHKRLLQREQGERVRLAGLGVAQALQFLHEHRIIYRDIKPANIGFSQHDGQVRLLDFGLARHVRDDPNKRPRKKLSGSCGTPRYTAPEVMLHLDYSFPADVHSFCILLWEIITLQRPYSNCKTVQELLDMTIQKLQRPPLTGVVASSDLKQVLHTGWSHNPNSRLSIHWIVKQLEFHVDAISSSGCPSKK